MTQTATDDPPPPILECDIVMKGGITSGVVYPLAVVKLSNTYRFRNIGGTSAGAIAAAATAAAELGRDPNKQTQGFNLLEELPSWLQGKANNAQGSRLMALFQAQPKTQRLFQLMLAALEPVGKWQKVLWVCLKSFWPSALAGAIPGILALWLMRSSDLLEVFVGLLLGVFVMIVGVLLAMLANLYVLVTNELPANNFGLCNGYRARAHDRPRDPPLTEWLNTYLNQLAGRKVDGPPLTFTDLQNAGINLLMMTSNLTHGVPHRLPFEDKKFFFDPKEFAQLFPPAVIAYLEQKNAQYEAQGSSAVNLPNGDRLWRFPSGDDLPVVVAVRPSPPASRCCSAPCRCIRFTRL